MVVDMFALDYNKSDNMPIGVNPNWFYLSLDYKVNYQSKTLVLVKKMLMINQLLMYGQMVSSPQDAVSLAARILTEHLNIFVNLTNEAHPMEIMVEKRNSKERLLKMTIEELDLSVRSY